LNILNVITRKNLIKKSKVGIVLILYFDLNLTIKRIKSNNKSNATFLLKSVIYSAIVLFSESVVKIQCKLF
jgi:hypothetical protein